MPLIFYCKYLINFYKTRTKNLLEKAPDLDRNYSGNPPNLFVLAVNKMINNLKDHLTLFDEGNSEELIQMHIDKVQMIREEYGNKIHVNFHTDNEN